MGVAWGFEIARHAVMRGQFVGQLLVLNLALPMCQIDSLPVQAQGICVSLFDAGDLGQYQSVFVGERRWIIFGPLSQLFSMHPQEFAPRRLLIGRRCLV